jgi:lysozyme
MSIPLEDYNKLMTMDGYQKIGFHVAVGGNRSGIGQYYAALDGAGIPINLMSADDYGACQEVVNFAITSGVPHVVAYRVTTHGQRDGFDYDVPQYQLEPDAAARIQWQAIIAKLPPEFDKERVWLIVLNEIDKNRADWLGDFASEVGRLAIEQDYKAALFGFATGEPDYDDWETPGMRGFLDLCAKHPDRLAIALHEYSLTIDDIMEGYPYLIGRVHSHLFDACDNMGIARPTVLITEWGWESERVPDVPPAMEDIETVANDYVLFPQILGAHIWYLGPGFGGIANQAQRLIAPVAEFSTVYEPPVIAPPVEPPVEPPIPIPEKAPGLDVSHWQGTMDWDVVEERDQDFVFVKSSTGAGGVDSRFAENWQGIQTIDIYASVYHYYLNHRDPVTQAEHFASLYPNDANLPPVLDVEDTKNFTSNLSDAVLLCLQTIEELTGRRPIIYTGKWFWDPYIGYQEWAKDYDLWLAAYQDAEPELPLGWDKWTFWQYSSTGDGLYYGASEEHIDLNHFVGNRQALHKYVQDTQPNETLEKHLWDFSVEKQEEQGLELNPEAALQSALLAKSLENPTDPVNIVHNEAWTDYEGVTYAVQGGARLGSGKRYTSYAEVPNWNNVIVIDEPTTTPPPPAEFSFTHWPAISRKITQRFGANPQNYVQFGLPGHDGVDIRASTGTPIKSVAPGLIHQIHLLARDGWHNYGNHVRVMHQDNYQTIYAHLSQVASGLAVGDVVVGGALLGLAGNSGNSFGAHLHLGMKKPPGDPISGWSGGDNWPYDLSNPEPFLFALEPEPPAPTPGIDTMPFFTGGFIGKGVLYEIKTQGAGQQRVQTQVEGNVFYHTKGGDGAAFPAEWEQLRYDDDFIWRFTDTSPGNGRYYQLRDNGQDWSKWCPRFWRVGDVYRRFPLVSFYKKADCTQLSEEIQDTWIRFAGLYAEYTFFTGIILKNVIELHWLSSPDSDPIERYWYAMGYGLVGWTGQGKLSAISEIHAPGARDDNVREVINCL